MPPERNALFPGLAHVRRLPYEIRTAGIRTAKRLAWVLRVNFSYDYFYKRYIITCIEVASVGPAQANPSTPLVSSQSCLLSYSVVLETFSCTKDGN